MEGYDNQKLQELQIKYLASRSQEDLTAFYQASMEACKILLRAYCRRIGLQLHPNNRDEIVHDAVARMIEWYLKYPDRTEPIPVAGRLNNEILWRLHSPQQKKADLACGELDSTMSAPEREVVDLDPTSFLIDLKNDSRVDGWRILLQLYRSRYYKTAILEIAKYTPKPWIMNHAVQLRTIFLNTRKGTK